MNVEKDEFLTDGGKSAIMTIRRRHMADRSRLELRQRSCLTGVPILLVKVTTAQPYATGNGPGTSNSSHYVLRPSVSPLSYIKSLTRYLTERLLDFRQIYKLGAVGDKDELIRIRGQFKGQGHRDTTYGQQALWGAFSHPSPECMNVFSQNVS